MIPALALGLLCCAAMPASSAPVPRHGRARSHRHHARRHRRRHPRHRHTIEPPQFGLPSRTGVDEGEYYVHPTHATVAAGVVELDPVNLGMDEHNMTLRDARGRVLAGVVVTPGETKTINAKLPAGTYTLYCSLYDHERVGMRATLVVR